MRKSKQQNVDVHVRLRPEQTSELLPAIATSSIEAVTTESIAEKVVHWFKTFAGGPSKHELVDYFDFTARYLEQRDAPVEWIEIPAAAYPGSSALVFEEQHKVLLENERLKSQLISEQRALLLSRQSEVQLQTQNEKLLDGVCELTKVNKALQTVLVSEKQGKICFHEQHVGVVTEIVGDQVEVTYEPNGIVQIYHRSQFVHGKLPAEGSRIEAHVIIGATDPIEHTEVEKESDLPNFAGKGQSGTIRV